MSREKTFFVLSCLLALIFNLHATSVDITTRTFPRFLDSISDTDTVGFYVPTYEYLSLNINDMGIPGLSLHASGWGRLDIGVDPDDKAGDGDFLFGYLDYRDSRNYYHIRLGRQFLFRGVALDNMDGILIDSTAPYGLVAEVFAGKPVVSKFEDTASDFLYGARLAYRIPWKLEVGISGLSSQENSETDRQNLGLDGFAMPINMVEVSWKLFYSLLYENIYEGTLNIDVNPLSDLRITLSGETIDPSARIGATSIFSVFTERYLDAGINVEYTLLDSIKLNGSYKNYQFETDNANRFGIGATYSAKLFGDNLFGLSFDQLTYSEEPSSETMTGFYQVRLFTENTFIEKVKFSLEWIRTIFDQYVYNDNGSDDLTVSAGYKVLKDLNVLGSIYYSKNPRYEDELQGSVFVNYNFGTTF
jgi:hypothetical protein